MRKRGKKTGEREKKKKGQQQEQEPEPEPEEQLTTAWTLVFLPTHRY